MKHPRETVPALESAPLFSDFRDITTTPFPIPFLNRRIKMIGKSLKLSLAALAVASLGSAAHAAPFLDDFSSDTSADYTGTDTFGSGGSHTVSGGSLNVTSLGSNTYTAFHNSAQFTILQKRLQQMHN